MLSMLVGFYPLYSKTYRRCKVDDKKQNICGVCTFAVPVLFIIIMLLERARTIQV